MLLDAVWLGLLLAGLGFGCAGEGCQAVTATMFQEAMRAMELAIQLAAVVAFWFGVSRLAEKSGLLTAIGWVVRPIIRPLFREIPEGSPALSFMSMNVAANLMGLGNAATPFGLRAMQALSNLGGEPGVATPTMVTFMVLNSATVNLVPAGMIALRAATGSHDPAAPYLASVLTTATAAVFALTLNAILAMRARR